VGQRVDHAQSPAAGLVGGDGTKIAQVDEHLARVGDLDA